MIFENLALKTSKSIYINLDLHKRAIEYKWAHSLHLRPRSVPEAG
jgi:hypothetical protein